MWTYLKGRLLPRQLHVPTGLGLRGGIKSIDQGYQRNEKYRLWFICDHSQDLKKCSHASLCPKKEMTAAVSMVFQRIVRRVNSFKLITGCQVSKPIVLLKTQPPISIAAAIS
jgi:hypothetical protein